MSELTLSDVLNDNYYTNMNTPASPPASLET